MPDKCAESLHTDPLDTVAHALQANHDVLSDILTEVRAIESLIANLATIEVRAGSTTESVEPVVRVPPPSGLGEFLEKARTHATNPRLLATWLRDHPAVGDRLAVALANELASASLAPTLVAISTVTVTTLRRCCDELYSPIDLATPLEQLLRQRTLLLDWPKQVRLWTVARLTFFAGMTIEDAAERLTITTDMVKRLRWEAGGAIDDLWTARYFAPAPDIAPGIRSSRSGGEPLADLPFGQ